MNNNIMLISDIISVIEQFAPAALQESFDNTGMQVGDKTKTCTSALLCVDATPAMVDEAIAKGCNLIISHHPLIFKELKHLTGSTPIETTVIKALRAGISIYSCHTAIDNATSGVSWEMARRLDLKNVTVLDKQKGKLLKLVVFVPMSHVTKVRDAIFDSGAGILDNYSCCSYSSDGTGTFKALEGANPYIGEKGKLHHEPESRIEVILPHWLKDKVEHALCEAHPYEVPAYDFIMLANESPYTGLGVIGYYDIPISANELVERVKKAFSSPVARCNKPSKAPISRVAMCGGAGSFLIEKAFTQGAQAFITSDTKYHDFIDYTDRIFIIDIGHFESEQCTKDIFYHIIKEKFPTFALYCSELEKNPISYL